MSIPASDIVAINPSLLVPGGNDLALNGMVVTDSGLVPPASVLMFAAGIDAVTYFGEGTPQAIAAQKYFLGYDGSPIKPRTLYYGRWNSAASAPKVVGSKLISSLADLKLITAGTLIVNMDGVTRTLAALNFSGAASESAIAAIIQTAMITAAAGNAKWLASICTFDGTTRKFTIGSSVAGASQMGSVTGTAAGPLGLAAGVVFQGSGVQTPAQAMNGIVQKKTNWVTFSTILNSGAEPDENDALGFAQWSNDQGVRFLYVAFSSQAALLTPNVDNIATKIKNLGLSGVAGEYGGTAGAGVSYAAFLQGVIASIDYNRPDGAITTAFRSQDGIAFNVEDGGIARQLEEYGFNFYGDYATANDKFKFHYPGQMFGRYKWIDTYVNAIWLNNALQVSLMVGLKNTGRAPYNTVGYTKVRAWMLDPIQRAFDAGVIDIGIELSESQRVEVNQQAGMNIADQLEIAGYYIQVIAPAPAVRGVRGTPIVNFWYTYGGSIHRLVVASRAIV